MKNFDFNFLKSKLNIDLEYFLKGGFWIYLGNISTIFKSLILTVLMANYLTKEAYGQYNFILATLSYAMMFALPGLNPSITQAIVRKKEGTYFKGLKAILKYSFIGSIYILIVGIYGWYNNSKEGFILFLIISLLFPLYSITPLYNSFFNAKEKFKKIAIINSTYNFLSLSLISYIILYNPSLNMIVLTMIMIQIIFLGYISTIYVKKELKNNEIDETNIKFGKKISLIKYIEIIGKNADKYLITFFLGFEALAIYVILFTIPSLFLNLTVNLKPLIFNKLVKNKINKKHILILLIINLFLFTIGIISNYLLFNSLFTRYGEYYLISFISCFIILAGFGDIFYSQKIAKKDFNNYKKMSLKFYIIGIIVLAITIPFGIVYAVIGKVIYRYLYLFIGLIYNKQ